MRVLVGLLLLLAVVSANLVVSVAEDDAGIRYMITNDGPTAVTILSSGTPFEAQGLLFFPVLKITSVATEQRVPYTGPIARRVVPAPAEAYLTIPAFSTLSTVVSVHDFYKIVNTESFTVVAHIPEFNPTLRDALVGGEIVLEIVALHRPNRPLSRANSYTNCDNTEKSQIDSSETTAQNQALRSKNCLSANSCNSLADKWFGSTSNVNTGYYDYDTDTLTAVYNRLADYGINAYCNPAGCGQNVYAYVYPNDRTYTVYLCGAFWSQPNERANTIVHEMSHFETLGGTEDYQYGQPACLTLANSNPYQASHNADNVCYFSAEA